jgi:hypothetical protein
MPHTPVLQATKEISEVKHLQIARSYMRLDGTIARLEDILERIKGQPHDEAKAVEWGPTLCDLLANGAQELDLRSEKLDQISAELDKLLF